MKSALFAIACAAAMIACSKAPGSPGPSTPPVEETMPPAITEGTAGVCGTRGGVQCSADEFCDYGGDELCGATDKGGHCKPITKACTRIYMPVCGCDSRTYGNECEAHAHGVSVKHAAVCTPDE